MSVLSPGAAFGRYRILSLLGKGGMGEVYLAEDNSLDRKVALKLLPAQFVEDDERLRRFVQEAKAASALNHPNIVTIYEIGQEQGLHFLATEYIDGQTLRQHMTAGRPTLRDVLDIATQAAAALAAAHAAGIVHRDIKPENMMLRRDGILKVLDFGLAKLTEKTPAGDATDIATQAIVHTNPGVVMGTTRYMSPEQARGLSVDARSDIFSLGVVLYEIVAQRSPFEGATPSHMIVSILEKEAPPLSRHAPDIPDELERIVSKALTKDREERYQSAKDVSIDLKRLRHRIEVGSELERATPSGGTVISSPQPSTSSAAATSSTAVLMTEMKRHKRGLLLTGSLAVVALAVAGYVLYTWLGVGRRGPSFQQMTISRLTSSGKAFNAAISPDGKYVVHVMNDGGKRSLWMRQVATGSNVQIVPPSDSNYGAPRFSRDGDFLYYNKTERGFPTALYQVPVLGGTEKKLLVNLGSGITLSPDGKRFAFVRFFPNGETALMAANVDGSGERELARRKRPDVFGVPAWSPDGKIIACGATSFAGAFYGNVVAVPAEGGPEKPIGPKKWFTMGAVAWLADGRSLALVAPDQASFTSRQIWELSYPDGEARRITNDLNDYIGLSLTADGRAMVTVQSEAVSNLWLIPNGDTAAAKQITTGGGRKDGIGGLAWTPDGRVVFVSEASGAPDLWITAPDGTNQKQLTSGTRINTNLATCGDGRHIVFISDRTGNPHVWRMDLDGGNPKQLSNGAGEVNPHCSPDGKWVVYMSIGAGDPTIWKVPIDGANPIQLTREFSVFPAFSPDSTRIAFSYSKDPVGRKAQFAVMSADGGTPTNLLEFREPTPHIAQWTPDGSAVTYVCQEGGVNNIWRQPLAGGPPTRITDFKTDQIFAAAWSADGKNLACSRGVTNNDVVLISRGR